MIEGLKMHQPVPTVTKSGTRVYPKSQTWCATNTHLSGFIKVEQYIKPSRSRVEIEELDSELSSGCRLSTIECTFSGNKSDKRPSSWPNVFFTDVNTTNWVKDNTFVLSINAYIKKEEKKNIKPDTIWLPFTCQNVSSCSLIEAIYPKKQNGTKYVRAEIKFLVELDPTKDEKKPQIPYIQFMVGQKFARYHGVSFKEGNIITIVIRHPLYPLHWPNPPIITVVPAAEQTFIPMFSRQKLVIITNKDEQVVDFKAHPTSTIKADGNMDVEFGKECSYFQCKKPSASPETIFINNKKKKKDNKRVVIPFVEKDMYRYPVILNPFKDAIIYSQNIDGFVIRFWKENYHPITIAPGSPIRIASTGENAQYMERKFELEKKRPFCYLNKEEHSWVIS
jgi:hypothetical protein